MAPFRQNITTAPESCNMPSENQGTKELISISNTAADPCHFTNNLGSAFLKNINKTTSSRHRFSKVYRMNAGPKCNIQFPILRSILRFTVIHQVFTELTEHIQRGT